MRHSNHAREMDEAPRRTARECQRIDSDRGEYHWQPWLGKLLGKLRMSCRGGSVFLQRSDRPRRSVHRGAIVTPATDSDHPPQPSAGRRRLCRRPLRRRRRLRRRPLRRRRAPPSARRLLRPTPTMTPTIAKQICSWQPRTPSPRTPFVLAARTRYATGSLRSSPQILRDKARQGRRCGEGGDRLGEPTTDAAAPVPLAFLTPHFPAAMRCGALGRTCTAGRPHHLARELQASGEQLIVREGDGDPARIIPRTLQVACGLGGLNVTTESALSHRSRFHYGPLRLSRVGSPPPEHDLPPLV